MSQAPSALDNYTPEFGHAPVAGFLRTEKLVKRYDGVAVVDEVSLSIRKGEVFALLGSSGCGKSTLLRMLAGFEKPSAGSIVLGGANIVGLPPHERPINMMFQSYALFPHLNVWDNIAFGLKREGMDKASIAVRVDEMLTLTQLESFAKRKPHQLSGGQQQRVALARSLAKKPQLLLLDEPLGALDKKLRERTQFELVNILQSVGVTCVMVTHDQDEAMAMASRIAVMSQGRVLQVGTPREIYEHPNCRFVADFIGNVNLFEGQLSLDEPDCCELTTNLGVIHVGHGVSGSLGMPAAVSLRPEKIHLSKSRPNVDVNLFTGKVREIAYFGSYSSFLVDTAVANANDAVQSLSQTISIRITQSNTARQDSSPIDKNDQVYFWWDAASPVVLTL
ncbi:Spermidine/putrescine import ATP-binding protein PotA [Polaromonas vacuolata]|uniref:Spermidine/putrescine import ATP-binding protein PotA n=1 Tax=Polaromonas vacuolata TaxID=37448 RepID=A0A6H2HA69_9BURK|nr:polyamine ABC transporter ATP-binding protein [Polaromonas vacuolata]QJC56643.1 Spermidine/putrescine import ATP-binding protein PotA [Polaromonas vacuolata]QJC56693.1 Spermidine/putrescine import ATP-binding protein PotA [Polaromonas vacuolata]